MKICKSRCAFFRTSSPFPGYECFKIVTFKKSVKFTEYNFRDGVSMANIVVYKKSVNAFCASSHTVSEMSTLESVTLKSRSRSRSTTFTNGTIRWRNLTSYKGHAAYCGASSRRFVCINVKYLTFKKYVKIHDFRFYNFRWQILKSITVNFDSWFSLRYGLCS